MKNVLSIVPFEGLYPPMNGGMLRSMNLSNQLAIHFNLTVIIHQGREPFLQSVQDYPAIKSCTVYSTKSSPPVTDFFSYLPLKMQTAIRYRFWNRSLKGPANGDYMKIYPVLVEVLKTQRFDYFILEDMGILNLAKVIRRYQPGARIFYDAYNVNSKLVYEAYKSGRSSKKNYEFTIGVEKDLSKIVDGVLTCSEIDLEQLRQLNKGKLCGSVVPNGVNLDLMKKGKAAVEKYNNLLFCGSLDYLPNKEGLIWFCREILPLVVKENPLACLMVVGKGDPGNELRELLKHGAIKYYGMVESVIDYYNKAAIAVVPLRTGSGTRLKVLEAMGCHVPIVSTAVGSEGIEYTNGKNILIADDTMGFASAVTKLLNDTKLATSIAAEAYELVENKYDWNIIGREMAYNLK